MARAQKTDRNAPEEFTLTGAGQHDLFFSTVEPWRDDGDALPNQILSDRLEPDARRFERADLPL